MTLEEAKEKTLKLLDEYGGGDAGLEDRIVSFLDMAQKKLAQVKPIITLVAVERVSGQTEYALPEDLLALRKIWRGGNVYRGFRWKAGKLVIPAEETRAVEIEYAKLPATIDEGTPDSYEFEIAGDAAQCMPFFAAAQCLASDLVQDGNTLLAMYQMMAADLTDSQPGESRVRNVYGTYR